MRCNKTGDFDSADGNRDDKNTLEGLRDYQLPISCL